MRSDSTRPTAPRLRAARAALVCLCALASAFACTRDQPPTEPTEGVGGNPCADGCTTVAATTFESSSFAAGPSGCTLASASVDCDDGDPCTKDVCLTGSCVHAPSSACDGPGSLVFAQGLPNGGATEGVSIAARFDGTTVFASIYAGTIIVDGNEIPSTGPSSLLLRKLDPGGKVLWQKVFGGFGGIGPVAVAVDGGGDVVLTGRFLDTQGEPLDFGGGPLGTQSEAYSAFVARLDAAGGHVWSKALPAFGASAATRVAINDKGTIAISGSMLDTIDLGGGPVGGAGPNNTFVAELDPAGKPIWARAFADEGKELTYPGHRLAFDPLGDLVVAGSITGLADVGGGPVGAPGQLGAFVTRLDPLGATVWSQTFPLAGLDIAVQGAAVDAKGNTLVSGAFTGTADFGAGPFSTTSDFDHDLFVVQLDPNGKPLWSRSFGDASEQTFCTVGADAGGNVVLAGAFNGHLTIGTGTLATSAPTDQDVFVGALDPQGNGLWARRFGDFHDQGASSLALDGSGDLVLGGVFLGSIDFGGGALVQMPAGPGSFVAKLSL